MTRRKNRDPIDTPRARLVVAAAAVEFGLPDLSVDPPRKRSPATDFARQVAMYLTTCQFGMSPTRVGELFGRNRTTVTHAVRVVEESRRDPVFDAKIDRLESFLAGAPA